MKTDSHDTSSLKPAELDEFGQLLRSVGYTLHDEELDAQVESFPLIVIATSDDDAIIGFLFGSLERVGGTPCILWGLGATKKGRDANVVLKAMVGELYRRAAISFPDEDVLVGGRFAQPASYALLNVLDDVVPRPKYSPTGEERAWGRRLAKRFRCDAGYDDRTFRVAMKNKATAVLDARTVKGGGKAAVEMVGEADPSKGQALIAFGWAMAEQLASGLFVAA
ncbi:MAG: hypothetical protein ACOYN3_06155 [Acidimicrobiia bacterium]